MGLAIGTLVIFLIVALLPIRGLKGIGIKLVLLLLLAGFFYKLPEFWDGYFNAELPIPPGKLQDKLGETIGGGAMGPLGFILGFPIALLMGLILRKKKEE